MQLFSFFVFVCFTDIRSRVSYRSRGHVIGISLTTITHSIIFTFTELTGMEEADMHWPGKTKRWSEIL